MKKLYLSSFFTWLLVIGLADAQQPLVRPTLTQGTSALSVQGLIDDDGDDFGANIAVSAGRFFMDYIEIGGRVGLGFRGSDVLDIAIAGYGEYNVDLMTLWFPYVGGSLGLGYVEFFDEDDTFLELQTYGGVRYFFVDHASIGGELALKLATEDIYNQFEDKFDWEIRIRTTWYF